MRRRYPAGDGRAVVHAGNQAVTIDVENLFGAMRRDAIRKRDLQPPALFAVFVPRLDFFRFEIPATAKRNGVLR